MKKLFILLTILFIAQSVSAQTVHRWEYEVSNVCSKYVTTQNTPNDLFKCLIEETRDYYHWRSGWEEPVNAKVLGILTLYQPQVVNLSEREKQDIAMQYRETLPKMYKQKMQKRKNLYDKFTQADVERIWNAR